MDANERLTKSLNIKVGFKINQHMFWSTINFFYVMIQAKLPKVAAINLNPRIPTPFFFNIFWTKAIN